MPTSKGREGKGMGKGKEGDGKGEGRKGRGGRKKADPRPGLRKCKGGNPKSVVVRQLCLGRIGVRGQKSLKTAVVVSTIFATSNIILRCSNNADNSAS